MSADFVPFLPGLRSRLASPGSSPGFAPITSHCAPVAPPAKDHKVEVTRVGDRVTHIQIHCRCGEVIEVECEY